MTRFAAAARAADGSGTETKTEDIYQLFVRAFAAIVGTGEDDETAAGLAQKLVPRDPSTVPPALGIDPMIDVATISRTDAPIVLDIGANKGQTITLVRRQMPKARIHSF